MDPTSLIMQLIAGAVGGNVGGAAMKNASLGTVGNTIAGAIGGLGGASFLPGLLGMMTADGGSSMIGNLAGGGIGGIVLQIVAGLIKNAMNKG